MLKRIVAIALALMLAAGCALAEGAVLTVQGSGAVSLKADTAAISLGIRTFASDVKAAQQAVNRSMDAVIAALTEAGVDSEDIYTSSISIYPEYDYDGDYDDEEDEEDSGSTRIKGYSASNTINVVTSDIDNVGTYIDAAFDAGANTLDDVNFSASNTTEASNEALRLAIADARAKAEVMAEAAGLTLGKVVSMSEGDGYSYSAPVLYAKNVAAAEDSGAATRVIASKQSVSATVTMQFEMLEK